jgi:hypothetical protein
MGAARTAVQVLGTGCMAAAAGLLLSPAHGAGLSPAPPSVVEPAIAQLEWPFRFVPYGWLTSMKGTQTARGRSYRALSVDYVQGEGRQRYEFDMLQHGPILGVSMRF